jgi:hypothetical protein
MRRADVIAIALAVVAGVFGVAAGTGPLVVGLAALVLVGLALRARSAQYVAVCAVAPFLLWATFPDPSAAVAAVALAGSALSALLSARDRPPVAQDGVIAARITLIAVMVIAASALLSFDLLLR